MNPSDSSHRIPPALAALTSAALALPALSQLAQAENLPTRTELGYRYSHYTEDDLDVRQVLAGSTQRYQVDTHAFRLVTPLNTHLGLTLDGSTETVSGASPYGLVEITPDQPQLVMTGASIDDRRNDVLASVRHYGDDGSLAVTLGHSGEDDYRADNIGIEAERHSVDRLTTLSGGLGYSRDHLTPEPASGINRPTAEDKSTWTGFIAITRVLSGAWQIQGSLFAGQHDGFLSDPYKARDQRPDQRQLAGFSLRSRYFLAAADAAVHTDYRYYQDDWGIPAHTLALAWYQTLTDRLQLVPRLRYYRQQAADFYVDADDSTRQGYQSSDARLSAFGAFSGELAAIFDNGTCRLQASIERYQADATGTAPENPALVHYHLLSAGIDYRF